MQIDGRAGGPGGCTGHITTYDMAGRPSGPRRPRRTERGGENEGKRGRSEWESGGALEKGVSADHVRPVGGEVVDIDVCRDDSEEAVEIWPETEEAKNAVKS